MHSCTQENWLGQGTAHLAEHVAFMGSPKREALLRQ